MLKPDDNQELYTQPMLRRMEISIEDLNVRIARLAIALHLDLSEDRHLHDLITSPNKYVSAGFWGGDAIQKNKIMELRALVVMRYGIEKKYSDLIGSDATSQLLLIAEEHMQSLGFPDGVDGLHLQDLLPQTPKVPS